MRHSRILLVAALALLAALVVVIATLGIKPPGPILSDTIQLFPGALATLAAFQAAKRSGTFGRVFWRLASVRELTCDILQARGYEVLVANGPSQALDLCNRYEKQIHLVLTDLVMPGMNGAEMADLIVKLRPGIQILFMSGYSDNALLQDGLRARSRIFCRNHSQRAFFTKW